MLNGCRSELRRSTLITAYPQAGEQVGVLRGGPLTPLPQPAAALIPMAAW